jgi:hypothetical protein
MYWVPAVLLFFCWITALATLLVFLESWYALSAKDRFTPRRASGAYGPVTVFLIMRGPVERVEWTIRSILGQSYPFIELFLIYFEEDVRHANLAREFRSGSHVQVRLAPVLHPVQMADDRIRALEHARASAKGRWYVILDSGVILDRLALEGSLEFAGNGEVSALSLRPGLHCRSVIQRLLAPALENVARILRIAERRREGAKSRPDSEAAYLLLNREAFEAVNRMNRMPGILNDSGWTMWGYQLEGLRTFDCDASRFMWRETAEPWPNSLTQDGGRPLRSARLAIASALLSIIPVIGLAYGLSKPVHTLPEVSILGFSIVSYTLMAVSYFMYAHRLNAASWFAPFWFVAHLPASFMILKNIRRGVRESTKLAAETRRSQKSLK